VSKSERQAFGLRILNNSNKDIKRLRKETGMPNIHGNKFWKSSLLLMDYLSAYPPENIRDNSTKKTGKKRPIRVLEVGCGWGLAAIFCAKEFGATVTGLDADETVFPYFVHHAEINGVEVETWQCRYEKVRKLDLEAFDIVIAADICFWDEMVSPLYKLVRRAQQAGGVRVVITDPGRPTFTEMAERCVDKLGAFLEPWSAPHPHNMSGWVLDLDPAAK